MRKGGLPRSSSVGAVLLLVSPLSPPFSAHKVVIAPFREPSLCVLKQRVISPLLPYSLWFSHSWLSFCSGANGVRRGGRLETAPPYRLSSFGAGPPWNRRAVIAFFMQPSADWPAANQRLVYTRWLTARWQRASQSGASQRPEPRVLTLCLHV